jgi:hypothetical protein
MRGTHSICSGARRAPDPIGLVVSTLSGDFANEGAQPCAATENDAVSLSPAGEPGSIWVVPVAAGEGSLYTASCASQRK